MRIAIVGAEGAKFTELGRERARDIIVDIVESYDDPLHTIISGRCHLGGVDIWAEEYADLFKHQKLIFPPQQLNWSYGYKPRNMLIARHCQVIHVLTVDQVPPEFHGLAFDICYHCLKIEKEFGIKNATHVKSGGCWTALQALRMKKKAVWHVVRNS